MFKTILLPIDVRPGPSELARADKARLVLMRAHLLIDYSLALRLDYSGTSRAERAQIDLVSHQRAGDAAHPSPATDAYKADRAK